MPTVGALLARSVARAARLVEAPVLVCAGRTDAGVHAAGQVVHVDLPASFEGDLARAVNRQTAPALVVRRAELAPEGFDARRSAISRHYRYLVWSAPVPEPLLTRSAWHVPHPLDLRTMAAATDPLLGEHDFRAFCRRPPGRAAEEPIVRRVGGARWREVTAGWLACDGPPDGPPREPPEHRAAGADGGRRDPGAEGGGWAPALLRFDIAANAFCHQMVRSVVAELVEAGRGRASAASVMELLASGSRAGAAKPAPPHGLCLVAVGYGGDLPGSAGAGLPPGETGR